MTSALTAWQKRQKKERTYHVPKGQLKQSEWITIDGEGWGRDEFGRQYYRFMVAANAQGFQSFVRPQEPSRHALSTAECLTWLVSLQLQYMQWCQWNDKPYERPTIGGFFLGYDYAHILTNITAEQLQDLHTNSDYESKPVQITDDFAVRLTAGNLRIYNAQTEEEITSIWDTGKFYQAAFLKVMRQYASDGEWEIIVAGKERRDGDADHDMNAELRYCLYECRVHSRAMNALQEGVRKLQLPVTGWYGPGSLAAAIYRKNRTKEKYWKSDDEQPSELRLAALGAYVGGRFETTGHGWLPGMYAHDIRSAYPAAMLSLPCLKHGAWVRSTNPDRDMQDHLAVGYVEWHCDDPPGGWGPYPMRRGRARAAQELPIWPFDGKAWVWSPEFRSGLGLVSDYSVKEAWTYKQCCQCDPFPWVQQLYDVRQEHKEAGRMVDDKIVKLIINSLYGKLAQSIGHPPMPTWIWAGLITQSARKQLLDAIMLDPEHCVMVATDAVYSTVPLELDFGPGLGQWDGPEQYGRSLVIQAGFWKDYDHVQCTEEIHTCSKTRGIAKRYVEPLWPVFEELWSRILAGTTSLDSVVAVRHSDHIGLSRARTQGIEKLGKWVDDAEQQVRFGTDKRPILIGTPVDGWWKSAPLRRDKIGHSLKYTPDTEREFFILEQPDAADWGYDE